ncbi:MAG: Fic family protein [Eubacteriales bacterium]
MVDGEGRIIHFGTLPDYVSGLVTELLSWAKKSRLPMLIKSCVTHYELELIHPFADGNGRTGRLWHTLMLSKWNPVFAWLPVESIVHDRQNEYYAAINRSNVNGESTEFISFMLSAIKDAILQAVGEE